MFSFGCETKVAACLSVLLSGTITDDGSAAEGTDSVGRFCRQSPSSKRFPTTLAQTCIRTPLPCGERVTHHPPSRTHSCRTAACNFFILSQRFRDTHTHTHTPRRIAWTWSCPPLSVSVCRSLLSATHVRLTGLSTLRRFSRTDFRVSLEQGLP